jgi:endonuclease-3
MWRIGIAHQNNPEKIEAELKEMMPQSMWTALSLLVILHGRYTCKAKKPECERCLLRDLCDYYLGGRRNV